MSFAKTKKNRKCSLEITSSYGDLGGKIFVSIDADGKRSDYWAERLPSSWGIAVRFSKIWDGRTNDFAGINEHVHVLLDGQHSTYECWGQLRWGNRHPCRHILAALQLLAEGKLQPAPRPEKVEERPAKYTVRDLTANVEFEFDNP